MECRSLPSAWPCYVQCQFAHTHLPMTSLRMFAPKSVSFPGKPYTMLLSILSEKGLVRRIQPSGSPARYEDRVGDNHHHLICRNCGEMVDVDCAVGYTPCLTAAFNSGYQIDEAEVIYWGTCPECLVETPVATDNRDTRTINLIQRKNK